MSVPALSLELPSHLHAQQGYGWHMHNGGNYMMGLGWGGWSIAHAIFWLVILVAIVMVTVTLVRRLGGDGAKRDEESRPSALDQLDERYARGEIDQEEYLKRKKDISER